MYNVGLIKFDEEIVGFALFINGQCLKYLYNEDRAKYLIEEKFKGIYQLPESLAGMIAGCYQPFWDNFLCKGLNSNYIKFEKIKEYDEEDLKKKIEPLLIGIHQNLLNE